MFSEPVHEGRYGNCPSLCVNSSGIVVEAHQKSFITANKLCYQVGKLDPKQNCIKFHEEVDIPLSTRGFHPNVAINDRNQVVIMWEHLLHLQIDYCVGDVNSEATRFINWGDIQTLPYINGMNPTIVMNNKENAVIVYENSNAMYSPQFWIGTITSIPDIKIVLQESTHGVLFSSRGTNQLSLTINDNDQVVAVRRAEKNLVYRVGKLKDHNTIIWGNMEDVFDDMNGYHPSIAITNEGRVILVQQSTSTEGPLSYRVGIIKQDKLISWLSSKTQIYGSGYRPTLAISSSKLNHIIIEEHEVDNSLFGLINITGKKLFYCIGFVAGDT